MLKMTRMLVGALLGALVWWLFCRFTDMPQLVLQSGLVAIVVLALLGKVSDSLLRALEQRLLHWRDVFDSRQG